MNVARVGIAFIAGTASVLNPCALELMPAWLARLTDHHAGPDADALDRIFAGADDGLRVSAGYLVIFVPLGLLASFAVSAATRSLPWIGVGLGVLLTALGIATVRGWRLSLTGRPNASQNRRTLVGYGAAYGLTALGCSLPTFLLTVGISAGQTSPPPPPQQSPSEQAQPSC